MEIKLSIKQDDIEQAIRDYVVSKGITTPVREINFQVARKGGFALTAEVEVSETPVQPVVPSGPINREPQVETQDTTPEPVQKEATSKPRKVTTKATAEVAKPEPEEAEVPAPEPVTEAEDKPPFEPDAKEPSANDDEVPSQAAEPKGKSLFG